MTDSITHSQLNSARDAAWNGDHQLAIKICSEALSSGQQIAALQHDFFDTRAESYIAQGQLDLAAQDAAAMIKIADRKENPVFQAQALNRQALVHMRQGELETAVTTATAALEASQASEQKELEALSFFRLAEAHSRVGSAEQAIESAEQAIALFQSLNDLAGEGRSLWALSLAYFKLSRNDETHRVLQRSLTLCQQAGDLYGVGNTLNVLTFIEPDIAKNLKRLEQARHAFESAGYLERQITCAGNLSGNYAALGLHRRANRLLDEAINISRQMGARLLYAYNLGGQVEAAVIAGDAAAARRFSAELEKIAPALGDPLISIQIPTDRGRMALIEKDYLAAITYFKRGEKIAGEAGVLTSQIGALSDLGRAYLAVGDPQAAVASTTRATELHRAQGLGVLDGFSSQEIWWRHSQTLSANEQREEALAALKMAYQFLLNGIASLSDEGLRRNYLNKIQINREIIAAWLAESAKQNLTAEERFAHLAGDADLSEPFQRLVDSGLRLNELRTAAELHEFLIDEATELSGAERVLLILETGSGRELAGSQLPHGADAAALLTVIDGYLDQARRSRTVQLTAATDTDASSISCIAAPLIAQNKVLGYLYADLSAPFGVLGESDRDMLGMLASQAAVALDNARWSEGLEQQVAQRTAELNERVDELAILNSVGEAMAQTLDVQTVTRIVGDKVRDIFQTEIVDIILFDRQAKQLHYAYSYDEGEGGYLDDNEPIPLGRGLTSQVIASRKPLVIGTFQEAIDHGAHHISDEGEWSGVYTESYLGVPILISDEVLGLVALQSYRKNAYDDDHIRLLQTLSANMGVAIENARLFEAEQQRVDELAILNSVGEAMSQTLDVQTVTRIVGDKVRDIFEAEVVAITLLNSQTKMLHSTFTYDIGEGGYIDNNEPFPLGTGLTSKVIASRKPLNLGTLQETIDHGAYFAPEQDEDFSGVYTESWLGVPILVSDHVLGIVGLGSYRQHAFDDDHVRLLQTLSANMGVAIENARLFEAEQQRAAELQIINSVQEGLASKLDMQSIYDLVGDKIRDMFDSPATMIALVFPKSGLIKTPNCALFSKIRSLPT